MDRSSHPVRNGFTLVELLVALMVSAIIFSAVAALTYGLGVANDGSRDTSVKQAQVRYARLRLSELLRNCKLICGTPGNDLVVWRADDNDDGRINVNELVYIERGPDRNYLRLAELPSISMAIGLWAAQSSWVKGWLMAVGQKRYTVLLPECSNVEFLGLDPVVPRSRFVTISFDLQQGEGTNHYQVSVSLLGWGGNLLNDSATTIVSDDD